MPPSPAAGSSRRFGLRAGLFFLLVIRTIVLRAAEPAAPEPVDTIMKKIAAVYSTATTYQDEGVTLAHDPSKDLPDEIVFRTAFRRPAYFRFEWISHHPYPPLRHLKTFAVTWGNDSGVFSYTEPPQPPGGSPAAALQPRTEVRRDISGALAAAAGVSRLSSINVLSLLSADVRGSNLLRLQSVDLVGLEDFDRIACYRLRGFDSRGMAVDFWVSRVDYLVRRVTRVNGASGHVQEEIRRNVRINEDISKETFEAKGSK
jgi:hypothetical protein